MIKQIITVCLCTLMSAALFAQKGDPVLFSVADKPVHLSEFMYIYTKTNRDKADFSKKSLEEYMDLYTKFKLKVQRARDLKLDTIATLKQELEGYRQQLADSYLLDKAVTEKLIKEAYTRSQKDLSISHIMVGLRKNPTSRDTLLAYKRIMQAKERLDKGEDFVLVAKELSEDKSVSKNNGNIGYFTAPFPKGFYTFETAAYDLKNGGYSTPVRTPLGYQIIKIDDVRAARGEIEVAHILIRKDADDAEATIQQIHKTLKEGGDFEAIAKEQSQDTKTAAKGGYVGFFGISTYERAFEDAAFSLTKDGEISAPFLSKAGWHVLKRITKKPVPAYEVAKPRLKAKIQKDNRYELAKMAMVEQIKKENNFSEDLKPARAFAGSVGKEFTTFGWKAPTTKSTETIFTLGETNYTLGDFTDYLGTASRARTQYPNLKPSEVVKTLYSTFVTESSLKYEERNLERKYPDFKALMREYREGILLFEITKQEVWDKASQDTTGLNNFYASNKNRYKWKERAMVSQYEITDYAAAGKIQKAAQKTSAQEILKKFNKDKKIVSVKELTLEKGRDEHLDAMEWKVGMISKMILDKGSKSGKFLKIEKILPAGDKQLADARGYVVADYQDYLEKKWIEELKKAYPVKVNKKTFKQLLKQKK